MSNSDPLRRTTLFSCVVGALLLLSACGSSAPVRGAGDGSHALRRLTGYDSTPLPAPSWAPWPQASHDAQHSGSSSLVGPRAGDLRWTRKLEGDVTPGPVVGADGTIYAASNGGVLHALDGRTGRDRWTVDEHAGYGSDLSTSPAVLPDGMVLWPGPKNALIAVAPDGTVLWRLSVGVQPTSPAVLPDGTTAVGTTGGRVLVLRPTRKGPGELFHVDLDESSYGSVAWSGDGSTVYQSVTSGVAAIRDDRVLWRVPVGKSIEVSPAVAPDGTVVIGTNDPFEYGLNPTDGSVVWRYDRKRITYSSPVVTGDGIAYFGDHRNRITGVDAATGSEVFSYQGSRRDDGPGGIGIWTAPAVDAAHSVFVGTRQGLVYGVDRTGKRLWTIETGATVDSYPALSERTLVIGVSDGRLVAIGDR
jgi:outer membrane protein assembly factor BamB